METSWSVHVAEENFPVVSGYFGRYAQSASGVSAGDGWSFVSPEQACVTLVVLIATLKKNTHTKTHQIAFQICFISAQEKKEFILQSLLKCGQHSVVRVPAHPARRGCSCTKRDFFSFWSARRSAPVVS